MLSQLRIRLNLLIHSRRNQVQLVLFVTGALMSAISFVLLFVNSEHLKSILDKYANLYLSYQLSNSLFETRGLLLFAGDHDIQIAFVALVFLALSVLVIFAFGVSVGIRSLRTIKVRLALIGDKSINGIYRLALGLGATFLTLALLPGAILSSALEDASRAFSAVEKSKAQLWSDAKAELPKALEESLNAHVAMMKHETAKSRAQMDCRVSSSAGTYYEGDSTSEAGTYYSCSLSDYLDRIDSRTEDSVFYADNRLKEKERAVDTALVALNTYKGNVETLTFAENIIRYSQLVLLLIAGVALLVTCIATAMQVRRVETQSTSLWPMVAKAGTRLRRVKCPKCAEYVKSEALLCKHCGSELQ